MGAEITSRQWIRWMGGILLFATALRIAAVLGNGRFWFDEIISWEIAIQPWADMWKYLVVENHPPLHYVLVHFWMQIFGTGDVIVKLSSVCAGVLGIWVTGLFGRRLFGARAGLWAAGFTAISTYQMFYSAEARMYPWLYLFGVISLWMWWELLHSGAKKWGGYWFFSTIAALYTHLGGAFLLAIEGIWWIWHQLRARRNPSLWPVALRARAALLLMAGVLLAWTPWLVVFMREKAQTFNRNAWYFWVDLVEPLPIEATRRFFFFDSYAEFMDLFAWLFVIGAFALALGMMYRDERGRLVWRWEIGRAHGYCLAALFIPLFIGFLTHVSVIKIYTVAAAGAYLLAGAGLAKIRIPSPIPPFILPAVIAALFFAHSVGVIVDVKPAWREVAAYLSAREGEAEGVVMLSHAYEVALAHYYRGGTPILPFYPLADDTGGDTLLRAVRRNWYTILTEDNIDELSTLTAGKKRLFLLVVGRFYKVERIGLEWFMAHDWRLKSVETWNDYMVNPELYLLEAP